MFKGSYVAIVTPFVNGKLDQGGLRKNIRFLMKAGSAGLVACATTGESPTLSEQEYETIIRICAEEAKRKIPVIAGAGTNSTEKTIKMMHRAQAYGATGLLAVTPYYNRPTQEGLYQHYRELNRHTDLSIIIYNVPSRTGVNILPKTVARLADECRRIKAIKEASGNLDQVSELKMMVSSSFDILSGDDSLTFPMMAIGAKGVISVIANILPKDVARMCDSFFKGHITKTRELHLKMFPVVKALFAETSPVPVKKAMELMHMPAGKPRLPLVEMSRENTKALKSALIGYGIKL